MDNDVKGKLSTLENNKSVGKRLVEAFGTDDKEFIAKILGFKTVGGLYKVLSGERELDFVKLKIFRNHTKRTIDWLLTGELDDSSNTLPDLNKKLLEKLTTIAREQSAVIYADLEIGGHNVNDATLRLLIELLLNRAMHSLNLLPQGEWLMSAQDRKRAEKFTFVSNVPQSVDDRIREIVEREMSGKSVSPLAQEEAIRDMIRELIKEEVGGKRGKNLLITHDFGEGKEPVRKAG